MPKAVSTGAEEGVPPEPTLGRIRVSFIQRATLTLRGAEQDALVIDVGLAGVFVEREQPLPVGEEVQVRFRIPGNEIPIAARCRVAWWHPPTVPLVSKSLPPGIGLEFVELSDADRNRLRALLEEHCRRDPRARQFARHWPHSHRQGDDP